MKRSKEDVTLIRWRTLKCRDENNILRRAVELDVESRRSVGKEDARNRAGWRVGVGEIAVRVG